MYASSSPRRRLSLTWLALAALLAACGPTVQLPGDPQNPDNPQNPPLERGYTECGDFLSNPPGTKVRCQPGQYCQDQTFSKCEPGCTSDANCAANQVCVKESGKNVGSCQNTTTPACSAAQPCPSGQTCVNGQCTVVNNPPACSATQPCPSGQTCVNGQCTVVNNPPACSASVPCPSGKVCVSGICSAPPPTTQCTPRPDGLDGCSSTSVCMDPDEAGPQAPACYAFDACNEQGRCPTGLFGAVCNQSYIPNKARFCIPGFCADNLDCPTDWACVKYPSTEVLGTCSNRGPGSMCTKNSECLSGVCNQPQPGFPGSCNP
jgi:hypothetical protein